MTHLYFADDRNLLAGVDGMDMVLGGHDHEPISFLEGDTLIAKAGSDMHYLAAIDLRLGRAHGEGQGGRGRHAVLALSAHGRGGAGARGRGHRRALERDARPGAGGAGRPRQGRARHPPAQRPRPGRPISAISSATRCATPRGAEVALTNGGGIRGDRLYPAGTELTRKDILTELPFGNVAVLAEVTGADLLAALENGVSQVEDKAGRFPQVSGMSFVFDATRPAGSRMVEAKVGGTPLDPAGTYRLATSDYLLGGGDGYASLKGAKAIIDRSAGRLLASTVMNYITALGGEVTLPTDGRIERRG